MLYAKGYFTRHCASVTGGCVTIAEASRRNGDVRLSHKDLLAFTLKGGGLLVDLIICLGRAFLPQSRTVGVGNM
jgi:hypothetical protein